MADVHEYVLLKFRDGISKVEQIDTMRKLDAFIERCDGFKGRDYFYSEADNRWIDHVVWASEDAAKASEKVMENPTATALFRRMDNTSIVFGHYTKVEAK